MRKEHITLSNFKIVAVHDDEKLDHFIIADRNGEKLSAREFALASEAIEYGYEFIETKGLLNG